MCSDSDPRAALADYIRHKTDNGNQVVDYLHDVLHENLDDVKHGHRTRAAGILSEYGDLAAIRFLEKEKEEKKAKPSPKPRKREEREDSEFDTALARVIRDKTNDAEDVADYLIDTMNGVDSSIESGLGKIHHQQRVSAAAELLRRAYDNDPRYAHTSTGAEVRLASQPEAAEATPEAHPDASKQESAASEHPENPASDEEPVDYVAMAKEIVANLDPSRVRGRASLHPQARYFNVGHHHGTTHARHHRRTPTNSVGQTGRKTRTAQTLERVRRQNPDKERP